ncbi:MAG: site-2 protease family protein [Patescibacteria group bacterium]
MSFEIIFVIAILIISVIIHEISHGYAALYLGDPTAKNEERLTLNPMKHIDPMGSIFVPLISYFVGGFVIGWAKPVPYNPYNLKNQKWGEAIVAGAGPSANILLAIIFGLFLRYLPALGVTSSPFLEIVSYVVVVNLILAIFNLAPIPPFDGSKVLFSILPYRFQYIREFLERNWIVAMAIFILFLWRFVQPIVFPIFELITGLSV